MVSDEPHSDPTENRNRSQPTETVSDDKIWNNSDYLPFQAPIPFPIHTPLSHL